MSTIYLNPYRLAVVGPHALEFNGASTIISCGSDASLDDVGASSNFTLEAWLYMPSGATGTNHNVANKGAWGSNGFFLYADANNERITGMVWAGSATYKATDVGSLPKGVWNHVAMVWDSSAKHVTMWINGSNAGQSGTGSSYPSDASRTFLIGSTGSAQWLNGQIAWMRFSNTKRYTAAFTPAPKDEPPTIDANTVEQWNLNTGYGNLAKAEVKSSNNGNITNGNWIDL